MIFRSSFVATDVILLLSGECIGHAALRLAQPNHKLLEFCLVAQNTSEDRPGPEGPVTGDSGKFSIRRSCKDADWNVLMGGSVADS
jgi:hypothetical protein